MREMSKKIGAAILVAVITLTIVGCDDSVDQKRLVELTGDKNFKQVKEAWTMSILQMNEEDQKVYGYWLRKNGEKAEATFNFESFRDSFMMKYDKEIENTKKKMEGIKKIVDSEIENAKKIGRKPRYVIASRINEKIRMASFAAPYSAYIRKTYIPFLRKQEKRIFTAIDEAEKYQEKKSKEDYKKRYGY